MGRKYVFVEWLDPDRKIAVFYNSETGEYFTVPRSRLIPYPGVEEEYTRAGVLDPNEIVDLAVEEHALFGIPIHRWYEHKRKIGELWVTDEDIEEAYYLPKNTDFSCIRDCLLAGRISTQECIEICTPSPIKTPIPS